MIVRPVRDELWLFDQRDHSELCGRMAEAWGAPPFAAVPGDVRRAAAIHDGGWPEWDRRPRLDPSTGLPHPYSRMPDADYHEIWVRGLARGWDAGDVAGLLVSLHAMRFFGKKRRPDDRALYDGQRRLQAEALRRLGAPADADALAEPFATWHAWLFFWDGLSLFLCEGWDSPWVSRLPAGAGGGEAEVRVERIAEAAPGGTVEVRPFPFTATLELGVSARVVSAGPYAGQRDLDDALDRAHRREARWTVRPAS